MSIREKPNAKRYDDAIFNQTRPEVTLLAILAVVMVFLFPAVQGPYSVVHGPATAFRATQSARIADVSIAQGALHLIREPIVPLLVETRSSLSKTASPSGAMPDCNTNLRC